MIIRTDLYEVWMEGKKPPYNPLPLVLTLGFTLLVLAVGDAWYLSYSLKKAHSQNAILTAESGQLSKDLAQAKLNAQEVTKLRLRRQSVLEFAYKRVSWAPLLQEVFAALPDGLELFAVEGSTPLQENCWLHITGKAADKYPRLEADKFRSLCLDALKPLDVDASFTKLEDVEKTTSPLPEAEFVITLRWSNRNGTPD